MTEQLELAVLPVAAPGVQARRDREARLAQILEMIRAAERGEAILASCPEHTTLNIARALYGEGANDVQFRATAGALSELRRRGALDGTREWCPYNLEWFTVWMTPIGPRSPAKRPRPDGRLPARLDP